MKIENKYLDGTKLWGDDFNYKKLLSWYKDEKEGYSSLGQAEDELNFYPYERLNFVHGFKKISEIKFNNVLGFGSAGGQEFEQIKERVNKLTIIDPSEKYGKKKLFNRYCKYIKPSVSGKLRFKDNTFDLVTCLGVLHHIPNVTYVLREIYRCLIPGGVVLIREPIISMGDWTKPRPGLTKRERGIPLSVFRKIIFEAGFQLRSEDYCMFVGFQKIMNWFHVRPYNNNLLTFIDSVFSYLFAWNIKYFTTNQFFKIRPTCIFYVLEKPPGELKDQNFKNLSNKPNSYVD